MIVTLTGSTRFLMAYDYWNERLSLEGNIVFSYVPNVHHKGTVEFHQVQYIQKWKISMSNLLFVIDCASLIDMQKYIGDHTKDQIDFATAANCTVVYASAVLMNRPDIKVEQVIGE